MYKSHTHTSLRRLRITLSWIKIDVLYNNTKCQNRMIRTNQWALRFSAQVVRTVGLNQTCERINSHKTFLNSADLHGQLITFLRYSIKYAFKRASFVVPLHIIRRIGHSPREGGAQSSQKQQRRWRADIKSRICVFKVYFSSVVRQGDARRCPSARGQCTCRSSGCWKS